MKTKTYLIKMTEDKDGFIRLTRTNDGFDAFELLGVIETAKDDILNIIKQTSDAKIDVIKRQVIEE